jgi:hypothetical protein
MIFEAKAGFSAGDCCSDSWEEKLSLKIARADFQRRAFACLRWLSRSVHALAISARQAFARQSVPIPVIAPSDASPRRLGLSSI